ncbi:hypothetical protein A2635_01090 [Candidatus Peribacteria bacterium RIFCSPHIGHO2_01_FULL_51_9]|nr:MAG: hypothetical protein A2635_01090 [Candidatus Peribacteria bacterium RIFCSPHIGHO2_01_FULL_51_9]
MQCFILAGGFATRLWPLTEKRAKPLLPLAGKPMIDYLIENIPENLPITISTNAVFQKEFEEWKKNKRKNITLLIEYAERDDQKVGALGAVAQWLTHNNINDDVFLLTGDNYFGFKFQEFLDFFFKEGKNDRTLFVAHDIKDKEKAKQFGVVLSDGMKNKIFNQRILAKDLQEKPLMPLSTIVSTGCYIFPKHTLPKIVAFAEGHPDNLGGVIAHFLHTKEPVDYVIFNESWFDIGSFDAYLEATKALIGNANQCHETATIKQTLCNGSTVIGAHSSLEGSTLTDSVIFEHCSIRNCIIERCVIDNHCTLENIELRGQMLREGTTLRRS